MQFQDLLYEVRNGVAWITINRPDKMNAFRGTTCDELIRALNKAGYDKDVGAIVLAGAGDRAFCTGGDQSAHDGSLRRARHHRPADGRAARRHPRRAEAGDRARAGLCHRRRQRARAPSATSPSAREKAIFGQVGPKMGSVDPGYGTAFLARVVGEKKAREIWYLCRRYTGEEAVAMGLANVCVPHEQLDAEVQKWGEEICERSPTALAIAKRSFNMDTAHQAGIAGMGMYALKLFYDTEESKEGVNALKEKRKPEFRKYVK